jgi:alpha-beta hydrolase superfamily lysophospholipase
MKLLYLHGLYSKPGGTKPSFLLEQGFDVLNPALPDDDFARSLEIAQAAYDTGRPEVVVGSSRGGAVAMNLDSGPTPLVLVAPAWKRWGSATRVKPGTIILHARGDAVVPIADSAELIRSSGLPESALVVVGADHNMVDAAALRALVAAIEGA